MEIVWIALILFVLGLLGGYGWMLKTSIESQSTSRLIRQMWVATIVLLPLWIAVAGLSWALCCMEPSAAQWRAWLLLGWVFLLLLLVRHVLFSSGGATPDGSGELLLLLMAVFGGTIGQLILLVFF